MRSPATRGWRAFHCRRRSRCQGERGQQGSRGQGRARAGWSRRATLRAARSRCDRHRRSLGTSTGGAASGARRGEGGVGVATRTGGRSPGPGSANSTGQAPGPATSAAGGRPPGSVAGRRTLHRGGQGRRGPCRGPPMGPGEIGGGLAGGVGEGILAVGAPHGPAGSGLDPIGPVRERRVEFQGWVALGQQLGIGAGPGGRWAQGGRKQRAQAHLGHGLHRGLGHRGGVLL